jgi:hypothetical protein
MAKPRTPIPKEIAAEVLVAAERRCCICKHPSAQIHHIDKDPTNHSVDNLAVLCPTCHDEAHASGPFTRDLDPAQVRLFRDNWNEAVAGRTPNPHVSRIPETEKGKGNARYRSRPIALLACAILGLLAGGVISLTLDDAEQGSPGYAKKLNSLLRDLNGKRATAYRQLEAPGGRRAKADIAADLGGAFDQAARTVRRIRPEPADRKANRRIARRLETAGRAYKQLGNAVTDPAGGQEALDHARRHVESATRQLWTAQKALTADRYRIERLV